MSSNLKLLWSIIIILFAVVLYLALNSFGVSFALSGGGSYYAVYMDSGEIYFGKLRRFPTLSLSDVYYLVRVQDNTQGNSYALKRFHDEQWGPDNTLKLNPAKVVWMTELRPDGGAMAAIQGGGNAQPPVVEAPSPSPIPSASPSSTTKVVK